MDFGLALWGTVEDGSTLMNILTIAWRVAIVVLGINAVIIVHEWGHFIVARLCGVRCDKFYIWFDAWGFKFFHFKWGDTEYGLGWLPLGGYVKMLGQEDNPGAIREEIERAKLNQNKSDESLQNSESTATDINANEESLTKTNVVALEELEKSLYAPDSYLSKNVLQRMAIISAGVFMNVVFAIICGMGAGLLGYPEATSLLGEIMPGSPAWQSGLKSGDKIVEINGTPIHSFMAIQTNLLDGNEVEMKVLKSGTSEPVSFKIQPQLKDGGMTPIIGVLPSSSLKLAAVKRPYETSLSETENEKIVSTFSALDGQDKLKNQDRIFIMNDVPVKNYKDYERLSLQWIDQDIVYEFASDFQKGNPKKIKLPPRKMKECGIRLKMGPITAVRKDSVAQKAGILAQIRDSEGNITQKGDLIVSINNEPIFDPLKFPFEIMKMAQPKSVSNADSEPAAGNSGEIESLQPTLTSASQPGTSVVLTLLRDGKLVDVSLILDQDASYADMIPNEGQLASDYLGIAYEVLPVVDGINATVQVDKNPIGGTIKELEIFLEKPSQSSSDIYRKNYENVMSLGKQTENGVRILFNDKNAASNIVSWFVRQINLFPNGTKLQWTVALPNEETTVLQTTIQESENIYKTDRGFYFAVDTETVRIKDLGKALVFGWDKTLESMGLIFVTLKNLGGNVSVKALGGPGTIISVAYTFAGTQDGLFLFFLCLIGANLAVINFLPIPVLDGGHIVFLLYEAIFRRPPNENIQVALSFIGLFLILALMFWVIWLDILRFMGML
ncbi:MAG: site-2 protease family protein [Planctomycetia bacterium]|nr:site-2 protease family protein [Planctomycetia bacterium]